MIKGEITIDSNLCQGCGYCARFCNQGCIEMTKDKFNAKGYLLPIFIDPESCTGCQICAWMCPAMAIEVYKCELKDAR